MVMPFLVKALLDNRDRYARRAERHGEDALFEQEPGARGYLRPQTGYRLFEQRDALCEKLTGDVRQNRDWLFESMEYPLAGAPVKR
jgi:deoxyhypusine synthase